MKHLSTILIVLAVACAAASGVPLYDSINGTARVSFSGTAFSPKLHPEVRLNFRLETKSDSPYTSFGYYIIANGQSTNYTLEEGDNLVETNQFLGLWAKLGQATVYYSAENNRLWGEKSPADRWTIASSYTDEGEMIISDKDYPYSWWHGYDAYRDNAVASVTFTPWVDPTSPSGQPLPAAIVSLVLMGGIGGGLGLQKRRARR